MGLSAPLTLGTMVLRLGGYGAGGATGSGIDKDSKGQRKLEHSGVGPLPAVEGHSPE